MKETTRALLDQIDQAHDWAEGQVWSGGGTKMSQTDTCRVCGLRRHSHTDPQNGVDEWEYRFSDGESDADLSLRQAAARTCL